MQYEDFFCPFCGDYRTFKRIEYTDGEVAYNCQICGYCPQTPRGEYATELNEKKKSQFESRIVNEGTVIDDFGNSYTRLENGLYKFEYEPKNVTCNPRKCIGMGETPDAALNNASEKAESILQTCPKCEQCMGKPEWLYGKNYETTPKWSCDCGYERIGT